VRGPKCGGCDWPARLKHLQWQQRSLIAKI
jgi:hypothetical protein